MDQNKQSYLNEGKLHIVAVTAAIHNPKGEFLVIQRSSSETAYPDKWTLPGGKAEENDSLEDTLIREVKEEVGLEVSNYKYVEDFEFTRSDDLHVIGATFLCKPKGTNVTLNPEFKAFAWQSTKGLEDYDVIGGVLEDLRRANELLDL